MVDGGLAKHEIDLNVLPDNTPGLCTNDVNEDCCTCFKKASVASDCHKKPCQAEGLKGFCVGRSDPAPVSDYR